MARNKDGRHPAEPTEALRALSPRAVDLERLRPPPQLGSTSVTHEIHFEWSYSIDPLHAHFAPVMRANAPAEMKALAFHFGPRTVVIGMAPRDLVALRDNIDRVLAADAEKVEEVPREVAVDSTAPSEGEQRDVTIS